MDRRTLLRSIAIITGATVVGGEWLISGCKNPQAKTGLFSSQDVLLMDEIADTILPDTDIPGAKAAGVGPFMALMVEDCYNEKQQNAFSQGLTTLEEQCRKSTGKTFMAGDPAEREKFLVSLDQEAKAAQADGGFHYFTMIKQLVLFGYFTSEIGATQGLRYVQVPGRYDGCIPYTKGEKAWAL
ncbi:MAG: gluconate 2-dehydrogenase subunit 3 family protein [Saprospiraceae bacterium]|nr:gluconate 2-dehydrogenase subunit 3 family protein [Saprospiraceae bacterium]MCB9320313.1 gluconate 2-dehydrogenase subunit 3 family protein [Lewinellaceae bacterium]